MFRVQHAAAASAEVHHATECCEAPMGVHLDLDGGWDFADSTGGHWVVVRILIFVIFKVENIYGLQ